MINNDFYNSNIFDDGTGVYVEGIGIYAPKPKEYITVTTKAPKGAIKKDTPEEVKENNIIEKSIEHKEVIKDNINKDDENDGTRRLPTGEGIMDDKKYNDLIYAYMQSISNRVPEKQDRYVWKSNVVKKDIAKALKMNFRTFQRKFDYLVDKGYIVETERTYELPKISQWNFYIPLETIKYLAHTANENVIMVYSYLGQLKNSIDKKNKELNQNNKPYFTKSDLLIRLGYKTKARAKGQVIERPSTNQKDWDMINDILDLLDDKLNLIKCRTVKEKYNDGYIEKIYYTVNTEIHKKECYK